MRLKRLTLEKDFVAVITHDHAYDREIIARWGNLIWLVWA